jgi:hypothetical protein
MNTTVFGSGTCRLLHTMHIFKDQFNLLNSYIGREFHGDCFMGKQKNTRNHIQFLKVINKQIELPEDIKNDFFSAYTPKYEKHKRPDNPDQNLKTIQEQFANCNIYIFEIASIKVQKRGEYYVSDENTSDFEQIVLSKKELIKDLEEIISIIGKNKPIIFINHLRLHQFDGGPIIENRETVYHAIQEVSLEHENVFQYDPTVMVKNKNDYKLYFGDPWHYNNIGLGKNAKMLYDLILSILYNGERLHSNKIENIDKNIPDRKDVIYDSDDESSEYHKNNLHS